MVMTGGWFMALGLPHCIDYPVMVDVRRATWAKPRSPARGASTAHHNWPVQLARDGGCESAEIGGSLITEFHHEKWWFTLGNFIIKNGGLTSWPVKSWVTVALLMTLVGLQVPKKKTKTPKSVNILIIPFFQKLILIGGVNPSEKY